ncbi:MAG: hypothetical protein GF308_00910 [Candidatus Heimdallarchaeota archaeon]|nr:hypothetical protein [Candidatus Heimdallarchaeota archaeon]
MLSEIYNIPIIADILTFSIKRKKRLSLIGLPEGIKTKKLVLKDEKNRDFEIDVKDDRLQITTKNLTKEAIQLMIEILILNY